MVGPDSGRQEGTGFLAVPTLLIAAAFFLPVAVPSFLGWMNGLLAVPVFLLFQIDDSYRQAVIHLRNGLLLAVAGGLLINQLLFIVFSLTMIPLGLSFYRSACRQDAPAVAGAKGVATLTLSWFAFWTVYGILAGINPYTNLLVLLDSSFEQIMAAYRGNSDLPADVAYNLEQIIGSIRHYLPKILPGLLAGSVIMTVWLNQVVANSLLLRLRPGKAPWQKYARWQLPDKLIWCAIAAAILTLVGRGGVKNLGYWLAVIALLLYFFQGLAIFVHLLDRWKVPSYLRLILYVLLAIQSYGLLLLAVIGLADIWFDFRKLDRDNDFNNNT